MTLETKLLDMASSKEHTEMIDKLWDQFVLDIIRDKNLNEQIVELKEAILKDDANLKKAFLAGVYAAFGVALSLDK
jgi:hypothetical protein